MKPRARPPRNSNVFEPRVIFGAATDSSVNGEPEAVPGISAMPSDRAPLYDTCVIIRTHYDARINK